jgi:opacity protein-like surface antigen
MKTTCLFALFLFACLVPVLSGAQSFQLTVLKDSTPIRDAPSSTGKVLMVVPAGTVLYSDELREGWYRVQLPETADSGAESGYVFENRVEAQPVRSGPAPREQRRVSVREAERAGGGRAMRPLLWNAYVDMGAASSDFKGFYMAAGFQVAFTPELFGEIVSELYFDPANSSVSNAAYSFDFDCVYKFNLGSGLKLYLQGGVSLTWAEVYDYDATFASDVQFGLNAGAGLEIPIAPQFALRLGSMYKAIFDEGATLNVVTFFGGLSYSF